MSENRGQVQETTDRRVRVELLDANGQPVQIVDVSPTGLSVGRLPGSGLVLDASTVSRNHLRVDWDGQEVRVTDLGSRAGTQLGAIRLTPQVAQPWNPSTLIQIGPYTLRLRIEAASAATNVNDAFFENPAPLPMAAPATALLDAGPTGQYHPGGDGGMTGRLSDQPAQVEATLLPGSDMITVVPGIPARTDVQLTNRGKIPEIVRLHIEGVPAEWVFQPEPILLAPGAEAISTIQVNIPPDTSSRAGTYPVIIRVHAVERGEDITSLVSNWIVTAYTDGNLQATPKRIADRKQGIYTLALTNLGNHATRYMLSASDNAMELAYLFGQTQVVVEPGETVEVPLTVEAPSRLIGNQQGYNITIQAISSEGNQQTETIAFARQPLIPLWMIPIALLLLVGLGLLAASLFNPQRGTAIAQAPDLRTIVAGTATAAASERNATETAIANIQNQTSTAIAALPIGQRAAAQTAQAIAIAQTQGVLNAERSTAEAQALQTAQIADEQARQTQQVALQQTEAAAQATAVAGNLPTPTLLPTLTRLPATVVAGAPTNTSVATAVLLPTSTPNSAALTSTSTGTATSTPTSSPTGTLVPTATFTPLPGAAVISFGAVPSATFLGGNFTVTATSNSNGVITYSVDNGPCTLVSASGGVFSPTGAGTCVVRASVPATGSFNAGTNTVGVPIGQGTPTVTFGAAPTPNFLGGNFTVNATTNPAGLTLTYSRVSGPCAVVDAAAGTFSSSGAGTCVVQATSTATTNLVSASAQQSVTIAQGTPTVTFGAAPTPNFLSGNFTVNATTNPGGLILTYSRVSGPCAVVDAAAGTFSSSGVGTCVVRATSTATTNLVSASAQQSVTIAQGTPTVTFGAAPTPNFLSGNFTVNATTTPGGLTLTYSRVSGPCAVVDAAAGTFSSSGVGTCVVQATSTATANLVSASAQQSVTIAQGTPTVTFDPAPTPTFPGGNFTVNATTTPGGLTLTYSRVSGPCTLVNANNGIFNPTGTGDCIVQATSTATTNLASASAQQTVTIGSPLPPVVTGINPTNGDGAGGTPITVSGTNLAGVTSITINGVAATGVACTATQCTATTAPSIAGTFPVTVSGIPFALVTYKYDVGFDSINPTTGAAAGGYTMVITSNIGGFGPSMTVTIGGTNAPIVNGSCTADTRSCTVTVPAGAAGVVNVSVTVGGNILTLPFTYT